MVSRADLIAMIDRAIEHALRAPLRRIMLMLARGVVKVISQGRHMELQITGLANSGEPGDVEVIDGVEYFADYGIGSHPHPGAEHLTGFLFGNRANGIVIRVADSRYRLKGTQAGEVWLADDQGQVVYLTRDGIRIETAKRLDLKGDLVRLEGREVQIHATERFRWDVNGHGQDWLTDHVDPWTIGAVAGTPYPITPPEIADGP